jgi:C4-type Zn-finger protein
VTAIEAPTVDCPKCGAEAAFLFSDPRYGDPWLGEYSGRGRLEWDCRRCGFKMVTPTADADSQPTGVVFVPPNTPVNPGWIQTFREWTRGR